MGVGCLRFEWGGFRVWMGMRYLRSGWLIKLKKKTFVKSAVNFGWVTYYEVDVKVCRKFFVVEEKGWLCAGKEGQVYIWGRSARKEGSLDLSDHCYGGFPVGSLAESKIQKTTTTIKKQQQKNNKTYTRRLNTVFLCQTRLNKYDTYMKVWVYVHT